jgi:translation initiation factor 5A
MDEEGNCREDVRLPDYPDNFAREIQQAFESGKSLIVSVMSAMGHDQIIAMKEEAENAK